MSALLLALLTGVPPAVESPPAREQLQLCDQATGEEGLAACRRALALGLGPKRAAAVRRLLVLRLASLDRWEELVQAYRNAARLAVEDADAQFRLGSALLLAGGKAEEALGALREAERLRPNDARTLALVGMALNALGRYSEAVTAFEEALRLDAGVLDERPAARAVLEASRNRSRWP